MLWTMLELAGMAAGIAAEFMDDDDSSADDLDDDLLDE